MLTPRDLNLACGDVLLDSEYMIAGMVCEPTRVLYTSKYSKNHWYELEFDSPLHPLVRVIRKDSWLNYYLIIVLGIDTASYLKFVATSSPNK